MANAFEIRVTLRDLDATGVSTIDVPRATQTPARSVRYRLDGSITVDPAVSPPGMIKRSVNAIAAFTFALIASLIAFSLLPILAGYQPVVVTSGSMEPTVRRSDVVVLASPPTQPVPVGTVINFWTPRGDVIHRVVDLTPDGYRTKGDANLSADSTAVPGDHVSGVGAYLIPFVGFPALWVDNGEWAKAIAAVLLLVLSGHVGRKRWLTAPSRRGRRAFVGRIR